MPPTKPCSVYGHECHLKSLIAYAIEKKCSEWNLTEWCEEWGFTVEDFERFLEDGKKEFEEE